MKIIAIGRNYQEHAKELNNPIPTEPVVFLKPDTALLKEGKAFYHPDFSNDIHYEVELIIKIGKEGKHIASKFARNYIEAIGLGIDFTARDLQQKCKEKGLPWEIAKAWEHSAPISTDFIDVSNLNTADISFELTKNGQVVQQGKSSEMIFNINQIIAYISTFMTLKKGDLIYTGTPAGVGPVKIGDVLEGFLEGKKMFTFHVK